MSVHKCAHCASYMTSGWLPRGVKTGPWSAVQYDEYDAKGGTWFCSEDCRDAAERDASERADMSANVGHMPMTPHERAKAANAALTPEQRSAAGKARAAKLHHPVTLAGRIAKAWPELSDEDRRAVRRELRAAGIIA